jgi:hypothetical protein
MLRIELDGSIPSDNPVLNGVRSHVYSYGHRNPQGMIFSPDGRLFASEHGEGTDDEVNWVRAGPTAQLRDAVRRASRLRASPSTRTHHTNAIACSWSSAGPKPEA